MKARESSMPDEETWQRFFDIARILAALGCAKRGDENIVEFGSGYGTFTLPVARLTSGTVHALDIEPDLVAQVKTRAQANGIRNIHAVQRDFVELGSGLADASVGHAMLFNLLHLENPVRLLAEALRVLAPGGEASVIHWRHDATTPRGPSMAIRPTHAQCAAWALDAGFAATRVVELGDAAPFHYGLLLGKVG